MSVSIEDMKWEAELCREEMEQLSEDKLGKLENMARDTEEMETE
jgi:predicted ATP-grasp superfamily ATP-dependent carboligase